MLKKPIIMIVDDEPQSLAALLDALARRFGGDYRVVSHLSAQAALSDLERVKANAEQVALVIADQWMPEMPGVELLGRAHEIHPAAQRGLLVAWGDRTAAPTILQGCAFGQLENYLHKPWSPPEVHLYPAVSEFLADWTRVHRPRMEFVRVVGGHPSPRAHEICELLERNGIPYGFYIAESEHGRRLLQRAALDGSRLPVVILLDGHALVNPSNTDISDALGATNLEERACDLAIVGGIRGSGLDFALWIAGLMVPDTFGECLKDEIEALLSRRVQPAKAGPYFRSIFAAGGRDFHALRRLSENRATASSAAGRRPDRQR
jgi:thioredoxin reductase (NADPH)